VREVDANGNVTEKIYYTITRHNGNRTETFKLDEATHKVPVPDSIYGGTAYRVYVNIAHNASAYYVINGKGAIVTGSSDPTILYNQAFGGGKCNCEGECNCKSSWNPGRFDGDKGPVRL
jgi:hypothetical protein